MQSAEEMAQRSFFVNAQALIKDVEDRGALKAAAVGAASRLAQMGGARPDSGEHPEDRPPPCASADRDLDPARLERDWLSLLADIAAVQGALHRVSRRQSRFAVFFDCCGEGRATVLCGVYGLT